MNKRRNDCYEKIRVLKDVISVKESDLKKTKQELLKMEKKMNMVLSVLIWDMVMIR